MRIGIQGKSGAEVAQHTGYGLHIYAAGEEHGGKSVAQIVEANIFLDVGLLQQFVVDSGHCVRAPAGADAGRREQEKAITVLFVLPQWNI